MNKRIRELRLMADWSQFKVTKHAGVERTRLSLAENGHVQLRPEELAAIEGVLLKAIKQRAVQFQGVLAVKKGTRGAQAKEGEGGR